MKRLWVLLLAFPVVLWALVQGYQVWSYEVEGPATLAPVRVMGVGSRLCLDTVAAMGCPRVYYGYAPGPVCSQVGFWTCTGLFRADYAWGYWQVY